MLLIFNRTALSFSLALVAWSALSTGAWAQENEKPAAVAEADEAEAKDADDDDAAESEEASSDEAVNEQDDTKQGDTDASDEPSGSDAAGDSDAPSEPSDSESEEAGGGHDGDHHGGDHGHHDLGHGNASPSLSSPAALSKDLAIYTFVVFLGLLAVLGKFAWPTITEALEAREKRIEGNIAEAENKLEEAKAVMAEHEAKLAGAADQVRELLEEARRDADATIAQAKADAKAEFEAERQRATRDIEQAFDAAVRQLAEKTAGLAIDLAGRVVKQDISADRQSEIVREALGRFAESSSN